MNEQDQELTPRELYIRALVYAGSSRDDAIARWNAALRRQVQRDIARKDFVARVIGILHNRTVIGRFKS